MKHRTCRPEHQKRSDSPIVRLTNGLAIERLNAEHSLLKVDFTDFAGMTRAIDFKRWAIIRERMKTPFSQATEGRRNGAEQKA